MLKFCECGSIKNGHLCSNSRCPKKNSRQIRWIIDGQEYKFKKEMTIKEAEKAVKGNSDLIVKNRSMNNSQVKQMQGGY
jgi:hypothetical protein